MKSAITSFCLAACVFSSLAFAAPPAAPVVSVGASDIKQLQFDWPSVPGVGTYELWFRAAPGAQWVKYAETPAQHRVIRINVSVHLLDWRVARYRVAACNPSGCTNSAEVGVSDLALDAVGYLKQNYAGESRWFGATVAMSADGRTAAVSAGKTPGVANGVAYVYRKPSSTAPWRFEALLVPSLLRRGSSNLWGDVLAVNGDGTLIAYGRPGEGIGGSNSDGAVYLFRRDGTTWRQEKRLASTALGNEELFGLSVDLDDSGNTLAIWRSGAARFPSSYGVTEIYNHSSAGWQHAASIALPASSPYAPLCDHLALSGDGRRLLRTCYADAQAVVLVHDAPGWGESARIYAGDDSDIDTNYDGTLFVTRRANGFADVYRLQQNVWSPDSGSPVDLHSDSDVVSPRNTSIAMSRDGKIIAAGEPDDVHGKPGPNYPPIPNDGSGSEGSVYVFERKPSGWTLRRSMKPSVAATSHTSFGATVAIGADGKNVIVGAMDDTGAATGTNGDPADTSGPPSGAAWLY